jgi:hypothetical protein
MRLLSPANSAAEVLDRVYLEVRSKLLDIAACLDRVERADLAEKALGDGRWNQIRQGISILSSRGFDRAEQIQMLFSDPYAADWNRHGSGAENRASTRPGTSKEV